jgi:hypothetical protein
MVNIHWIVKDDSDKTRNAHILYACGGDQKSASILQSLVWMASTQENKIDFSLDERESFTVKNLPLDNLLKSVHKVRSMSKGTLRARLLDLQTRGYISIDGYHQSYTVYHHIIQKAFSSEVDKIVSRKRGPGRPRRESQENKLVSEENNEKTKLISEENKIDFHDERIEALESKLESAFIVIKMYEKRFEKLEKMIHDAGLDDGEKTKLISEKTKLISEKSKLISSELPEPACGEAGDGEKEPIILYNTITNTITPLPPTQTRKVGRKNTSQKETKPVQPQLPESKLCFYGYPQVEKLWIMYRTQLAEIGFQISDILKKEERESFVKVAGWFEDKPDDAFSSYIAAVSKKAAATPGNSRKYASVGWLANHNNFNDWFVSYCPSVTTPTQPAPEPEFESLEEQRAKIQAKRAMSGFNPTEYLQKKREQGALA